MPELLKKKKRENPELKLELVPEKDMGLVEKALQFFGSTFFGMTEWQIRKFILNDVEFPTPFSRWRQAKLEMWVRYQNIMNMHFDYREALAKIDLEKERIRNWERSKDPLLHAKIKISEVEIDRNKFKVYVIRKQVKDVLQEMSVYYDAVMEEMPKITQDDKAEDVKFWKEKMKRQPDIFRERYGIGDKEEQTEV